jgi:hypothetical protein
MAKQKPLLLNNKNMQINKWTSAILAFSCFVLLNFFSACDDTDQVQECNRGAYNDIEWLQDEIAILENDGTSRSRIEVYEYNGQVMFFSIPDPNDPSFPLPCILFTCSGAEVCRFSSRENTCEDFFNRRNYRSTYWER